MADKAPTGMVMMLKALGVNPDVFSKVSMAVVEISQRIERIENKTDAILDKLDVLEGKLNGPSNTASDTASDTSSDANAQRGDSAGNGR